MAWPAMEVMLTMAPWPRWSAWAKPRASASGAKKFSWKTARQASSVPFRMPRRSLKEVLGEIAALLTRAWSGPPARIPFAVATKVSTAAGSARSTVTCRFQFGSRRHSSGTSSREQVMMRQPSWLKRFTVAWPMPRLAPVRTSVLTSSAPLTPALISSMRHQHRYRCLGEHIARRAAEDHLAEPAMAVGAHGEEIGFDLLRLLQEPMADGLMMMQLEALHIS